MICFVALLQNEIRLDGLWKKEGMVVTLQCRSMGRSNTCSMAYDRAGHHSDVINRQIAEVLTPKQSMFKG